jgi:hypothetical protein
MMTDGQHMLHDAKIFGELIIMKLMVVVSKQISLNDQN